MTITAELKTCKPPIRLSDGNKDDSNDIIGSVEKNNHSIEHWKDNKANF